MKTFDEFFDTERWFMSRMSGKPEKYKDIFRFAKQEYEEYKFPSAIDFSIDRTSFTSASFEPGDKELVRKYAKLYAQYVLEYKMSNKNNVYNAVYYSGMGFLIGVMLTFLAMKHSESKQNDKQISATEQQNKYIQKMPNNTITFGVANQTKRQK